jgi:hypothetical protein
MCVRFYGRVVNKWRKSLNINGLRSEGTGPRVHEGEVCRSAGGWRGQRVWAGVGCNGLSVPPRVDHLRGGLTRPPAENRVLHRERKGQRMGAMCVRFVAVSVMYVVRCCYSVD